MAAVVTGQRHGHAAVHPAYCDYQAAAIKARVLFPGVVGEVLSEEVLALRNLPFLAGTDCRAARLYREIAAMDEPGAQQ